MFNGFCLRLKFWQKKIGRRNFFEKKNSAGSSRQFVLAGRPQPEESRPQLFCKGPSDRSVAPGHGEHEAACQHLLDHVQAIQELPGFGRRRGQRGHSPISASSQRECRHSSAGQ